MKHLVLPLLLMLLVASCDTQEVCDDDSQSYLVARFKTITDGKITDTIMEGMTIYGIREGQSDSLLYDSITTTKLQLPLDPNHDISSFVMENEVEQDTLIFSHSSEVYLISYTCGFAARFRLEQYFSSGRWMQDMEIRQSEIDAELESNEEHLWIYF